LGSRTFVWCNGGQPTGRTGHRHSQRRSIARHIPAWAMPVLSRWRPAFSPPTSHRFLVLVLAAVLTTGRRTTTHLRRLVRWQGYGQGASSHRVCSQRHWATWARARMPSMLLCAHGVPPGPVVLAGDATVDEPPGPSVFGKGPQRAGVRPPHRSTAFRWGQQWGIVAGLVTLPSAMQPWALPGVGSGAWHAASDASAHGPAAAGAPAALVSGVSRDRRGRHRLQHQRARAVLPATPPSPPLGQHMLWRCRLGRAPTAAHPHPAGTPSRQRPEAGLPHAVVALTPTRTRLTAAWSGGTTRDLEIVTSPGHG
jgi:hypothetical protein